MPKGKGYPDQFNLEGTMNKAGKKRLASQPTTKHDVPGANDPSRTGGKGPKPSESKTVRGMPSELK